MKKEIFKPTEKIEKVRVTDEDVLDWIKLLKAEGFSNEEIDNIMSGLNKTYRKKLKPNFIEEELEKIEQEFKEKTGRHLSKVSSTPFVRHKFYELILPAVNNGGHF